MIISQNVLDALSNDSASALVRRAKFNEPIRIGALQTSLEEVSVGYASIELIARFVGMEETPVPHRGRERWSNSEFYAELRRVFTQYEIIKHANIRNTELVDTIYDALSAGNPVIAFRAVEIFDDDESEGRWEMRYDVVIGVDLPRDRITLNDPHGFVTRISLSEFIRSVRFQEYEMSLFEILAFAYRLYQRNTIYIIDRGGTVQIAEIEE